VYCIFVIGLVGLCCKPQPLVIVIIINKYAEFGRFLTQGPSIHLNSGVASWWARGNVPPWRLREFFR